METKNKKKKPITTFDELIESRHGKIGSKERTEFEIKAKSFATKATTPNAPKTN